MIGRMPLWMVVFVWLTQRQRHSQGTLSVIDYAQELRLLEDLRGMLPIPEGKLQNWMVRQCLEWLDREHDMLLTLRLARVIAVGRVSNN